VALFFGLSGTGKTTLSADPRGASSEMTSTAGTTTVSSNFEGGCYAKTIRSRPSPSRRSTTPSSSAPFWRTSSSTRRRGPSTTIPTTSREHPCDVSIEHIPNAVLGGVGYHPRNVFFLTCDAFLVCCLPRQAHSRDASYHFLSASPVARPVPRWVSTSRAPRSPPASVAVHAAEASRYAEMLAERLSRHEVDCWNVTPAGPAGLTVSATA